LISKIQPIFGLFSGHSPVSTILFTSFTKSARTLKKLRLRDLFLKFPLLDKWRVLGLARLFTHGITFFDRRYRVSAIIPDESKPYVQTVFAHCPPGSLDSARPAIFAYYHGQMFILLGLTPRYKMTVLASNSRDGEMIARAAEGMGFPVARGSRTEGGTKGARLLLKAAREKRSLLFPVDGPRGPAMKIKEEILRMAQLSKLPIVPVVAAIATLQKTKSWDSYNCPHIFTSIVYIFGKPVFVPHMDNEKVESLRLDLETYMSQLKSKADQFFEVTAKNLY